MERKGKARCLLSSASFAFSLSYWVWSDSEDKAQLLLLMNSYVTFVTV